MYGCQLAFNQGCFTLTFCPAFLGRSLVGSWNGYGSNPCLNFTVCFLNRFATTPLIITSFICWVCGSQPWTIKRWSSEFPMRQRMNPLHSFLVFQEDHVMLNGLSNKRWLAFFRMIVLAHPHMSPDICQFRLANPKRALNFLHSVPHISWPPLLNILQWV